MKEFVVYTLLRLGLFVGAFALAFGVWDLVADEVSVPGVLVVAFVASGAASLVLLNRPREAFARRVQERAERATAAFEAMRSKEDLDDPASETQVQPETQPDTRPGTEPGPRGS